MRWLHLCVVHLCLCAFAVCSQLLRICHVFLLNAPISPFTQMNSSHMNFSYTLNVCVCSVVSVNKPVLFPSGMGVLFLPLDNIRHPAVSPARDVPSVQKEESSGKVSSLLFHASSEIQHMKRFHSGPNTSLCFKGMETWEWWSDVRSSACGRIWVRNKNSQLPTHRKRKMHQELLRNQQKSSHWHTKPAVSCRFWGVTHTFGPKRP